MLTDLINEIKNKEVDNGSIFIVHPNFDISDKLKKELEELRDQIHSQGLLKEDAF